MIELHYQGDLGDEAALAARLATVGFTGETAAAKASLVAKAAAALPANRPRHAFFVPGRIEVLGKHTDYAGGRTMVIAVDRGFAMVVAPREDECITVTAAAEGERVEFAWNPELKPRTGHWANYPMTVARRIARNFAGPLVGADLAFASDLPPAAGMSSSSAMMVGVFLALAEVNQHAQRPEYMANIHDMTDLAGYLGTVENGQTFGSLVGDRGVGTFGGSEDHTAILCGRPGKVSQYSYCPVFFERAVPVPEGCAFAVAVSGVVAEKTGGAQEKYNAASRRASALVELWRENTGGNEPHLAAILSSSTDALATLTAIVAMTPHADFDAKTLAARLAHFVAESEQIIPEAGDALDHCNMAALDRAVARSQKVAERLLGNQVPETSYLAHAARECGAWASCGFGAGFGGSVWALVPTDDMDRFLAAWAQCYHAKFPEHAGLSQFFTTTAGPPAIRIQ